MLVSCPPHRFPCYYGIDFSTKGELIACHHSVEEIQKIFGAWTAWVTSVVEGMIAATGLPESSFCLACFDGRYPVPPDWPLPNLSGTKCVCHDILDDAKEVLEIEAQGILNLIPKLGKEFEKAVDAHIRLPGPGDYHRNRQIRASWLVRSWPP